MAQIERCVTAGVRMNLGVFSETRQEEAGSTVDSRLRQSGHLVVRSEPAPGVFLVRSQVRAPIRAAIEGNEQYVYPGDENEPLGQPLRALEYDSCTQTTDGTVSFVATATSESGVSQIDGEYRRDGYTIQYRTIGASGESRLLETQLGERSWVPELEARRDAEYPPRAQSLGVTGYCNSMVRVLNDGRPEILATGCTDDIFEESATASIMSSRYSSAPGDGADLAHPIVWERVSFGLSDTQMAAMGRSFNSLASLAPPRQAEDGGSSRQVASLDTAETTGRRADNGQGRSTAGYRRLSGEPLVTPERGVSTEQYEAGRARIRERRIELVTQYSTGIADVFIYEPEGLGAEERRWLDRLERSLSGLDVVRGAALGSAGGRTWGARTWVIAGRVVEPGIVGIDLDFVQLFGCNPQNGSGEVNTLGSISNWGRVWNPIQYGFSSDSDRRRTVERSRRDSTQSIFDQIDRRAEALRAQISQTNPCVAGDIFRFGRGMRADEQMPYMSGRTYFGWGPEQNESWNVEQIYHFASIDAPQLGARDWEYYVEFLVETMSHISDEALEMSLYGMLEHAALAMVWDDTFRAQNKPEFLTEEGQFVRSNYRLENGHTLLSYLLSRNYDPVMLRQFFTDEVIDLETSLTARNRWGETGDQLLAARGIAIDTLQPDYSGNPFFGLNFAYPETASPRMVEAAIVGDNRPALEWLKTRGADFSSPLDFPNARHGLTPLALAVALDRPDAMAFLLNETDVNARHPVTGRTAIFEAYPSFTDADGRPVARQLASQAMRLSAEDASRIQNMLIAAGADTTLRDEEGRSPDQYWSALSARQDERNATVLADRAEAEDMQATLDRWEHESRQQTREAFMSGVMRGLTDATNRFAAEAREARRREAANNGYAYPVPSRSEGAGSEPSTSDRNVARGSSRPATSRASRSSGGSSSASVSSVGGDINYQPQENWGYMRCQYFQTIQGASGRMMTHWYSDIYRLVDTYHHRGGPEYDEALADLERQAAENMSDAEGRLRTMAMQGDYVAEDLSCTQMNFSSAGWTEQEAQSQRDREYDESVSQSETWGGGNRMVVIDSAARF